MMKSIALVFTRSKDLSGQGGGIHRAMIPQPLITLGSYLDAKGVKVYLIDGQLKDPKEEIEKIIDKVDYIGFSVMTIQISPSLKLSSYLKKKYPEKKIIWGGIHPSLFPEQTIEDPSVDFVCQREGEECLYELLRGDDPEKIKNLVYKNGKGEIKMNPIREFLDPNETPSPNWDLLDTEQYIFDYHLGGISRKRTLPVLVGRGCIFNCAFCVNTSLGRRWRPLSLKNMIKEVKKVYEDYNLKHIAFCDDCFDADLKRVDEFCEALIKENLDLTWDVSVRAGEHWTDERMKLMSDAGCIAVAIGAESGSQKVLDSIHKPITPELTLEMARKCHKYNISLISSWMCGLPEETEEDLKKTTNLLKKVAKACPSCSIHGPRPLDPYPNTELYFISVKHGFKGPKTLREWAVKSEKGFLGDNHSPWVKNPKKLRSIEFFCMNAFRDPKNFLHKILIFSSRFRLNHNFYAFPIEIPLVNFYFSKIRR